MKRFFMAFLTASLFLFTSCDPQSNDPLVNVPTTDTVLSKVIYVEIDSTTNLTYIDSSEFFYDNNGRIIKERYDGRSSGQTLAERSVSRDVNGIITQVKEVVYNPAFPNPRVGLSEVQYDYTNHRYVCKVIRDTAGMVIDSTSFEYVGNRFSSLTLWGRYRIVLTNTFYYSRYTSRGRRLFVYNTDGRANVLQEQQSPGDPVPWSTIGTQTLTYSNVINPLYNTDMFPFVARFCLEPSSGANISWDLESTSPYLPATQVYSQPFGSNSYNLNYIWQYTMGTNNRPALRKAKYMGKNVAVYYKYK